MENENTKELHFADGEVIIKQGDRSPAVYFVVEGVVKVTTHDEYEHQVELAQLQRGEMFGEMSLMGDAPSSATVFACGDVVVQRMTREAFMEAINSPLARMVMESLFARLRRMNNRFLEVSEQQSQPQQAHTEQDTNAFMLQGTTAKMRESMEGSSVVVEKFPFYLGRDGSDGGGLSAFFSLWSNDISVEDHAPYNVSRKHCLIDKRRDGYYLVDQHSHYGTLVDGDMVGGDAEQKELRLQPGRHRLQLGSTASPFVMQMDVPHDQG